MRPAAHQLPPFSVASHACTSGTPRFDLLLRCDRYYVVDPAKATPERVAAWRTAERQRLAVGTGTLRHLALGAEEQAVEEAAVALLAEVDCPRFTRVGVGGALPN